MSNMDVNHHAVLVRNTHVSQYAVGAVSETELSDQYYSQFGIDEARSLISKANQRPVEGSVLHMVVRIERITHEAQNALLKVLEEPPLSTRFTFVVARGVSLLPTLLSRFYEETSDTGVFQHRSAGFKTFLASNYADRLAVIEQAAKKKDLKWQQEIKSGLLAHLQQHGVITSSYAELEYVARHLLTRGASNKMLLEHAALHLPITIR